MKLIMSLICVFALQAYAMDKMDTYKIDPSHTAVLFKISHLGFSNTFGQFPHTEGTLMINEADPTKSSMDLKIKVDSINTYDAKRDQHLKGPDFFNSKQFPHIAFKSTGIKKTGDSKFEIKGDLTMKGVTKPVTIPFTRFRTGQDPWGKQRTGGEAVFKIKRSDFGINYMLGENQVGDEVELTVSFEGIKQ